MSLHPQVHTEADGDLQVWLKRLEGGRFAVLLLNLGSVVSDVTVSWGRDMPGDVHAKWGRESPAAPGCADREAECAEWVAGGECLKNPGGRRQALTARVGPRRCPGVRGPLPGGTGVEGSDPPCRWTSREPCVRDNAFLKKDLTVARGSTLALQCRTHAHRPVIGGCCCCNFTTTPEVRYLKRKWVLVGGTGQQAGLTWSKLDTLCTRCVV